MKKKGGLVNLTEQQKCAATHQATPQVTPQVNQLLSVLDGEMSRSELMNLLDLKDRVNFKQVYLDPALALRLIEMTQSDSPKSPTQKYRITSDGLKLLNSEEGS